MLAFSLPSRSQDPFYLHIDARKKLPSNNVYDIMQDKAGFIWVCHEEGLSRYDGTDFKGYGCAGQTSRAGSQIREDRYGRIWYQNFDGYLYYVQNDTMKPLLQASSIGYRYYAFISDRLFMLQRSAVCIYDLRNLSLLKRIPVNLDSASCMYSLKNDFYILQGGRALKLDRDGNLMKISTPFIDINMEGSVVVNGDTAVFYDAFNRKRDAFIYRNGKIQPFLHFKTGDVINSAMHTGGNYWFCTPAGVWGVDHRGGILNGGQPWFSGSSISSVLKDREGNYWFGTTNNGIYFVPDLKTKTWLSTLSVKKIVVNHDKVFIGTTNDKVFAYEPAGNKLLSLYEGTSRKEISPLLYDSISKKVFFSSSHFISIDQEGTLLSKNILAVKDCRRINQKYFAVAASGIVGLLSTDASDTNDWGSGFTTRHQKEGLAIYVAIENVRGKSVAYHAAGEKIIYATNIGLFSQRPGTGATEITQGGRRLYISRLQQYGDKIYALSTAGSLFEVKQNDSLLALAPADRKGARIMNIKTAGHYLFLLYPNSLVYRDLNKPNAAFTALDIYPEENGINDLEMFGETLLIAAGKGIIAYNLAPASGPEKSAEFIITAFKVNNQPRPVVNGQMLEYNENNVELDFSLLHFRSFGRFPLYYSINGSPWERISEGQRRLKLAALATGDYSIRFSPGRPDNKGSGNHRFTFTIEKPWWLKWWAFAIYILASALIFLVIYRWQTGILKKQNQLLDQKIRLEVALRKSMLKSIRAQMNPHFFYNALNTIQSFIYSEDKKNASSYLTRFSRLTRQVLEMSEKDQVTLSNETSTLQLYLELEQARFGNDFEFAIIINPDISTDHVWLPPMLIQPYVENAIKHGLLHKKGPKKLLILFALENTSLSVSIDDNGIGRKLSAELNARRSALHRPFSTGANEMRFKMMESEIGASGVKTVDKHDGSGEAAGTLVKLSIPVTLTQK